jgi:deazaflavin-dependent oxidoreductase (nitroreductase family)
MANCTVGGTFQGVPLILITTEGQRSGSPRTDPVTYFLDSGRYLVFGSNLGRPAHPGWHHNLLASPQVTMEIGTGDGHVKAVLQGRRPARCRARLAISASARRPSSSR